MKIKDKPELELIVCQHLLNLKSTIEDMEEKRGKNFLKWLDHLNNYLQWEIGFDPKKLKNYKRGEVVLIEFGFNVGSEHGGPHWGVILNTKHSSPIALVMPLGSLEPNQTEENVHPDDIYLGKIPDINDRDVYGIPTQIRAISKLRIIKPKKAKDKKYKLTNEQLDLIDAKLFEMFFSNSKIVHEIAEGYREASTADSEVSTTKNLKI